MKRAVVLLSGGMDSAVCAAIASEQGYETHALIVDYGQKNRHEIKAAEKLADIYCREKLVMDINLSKIGGSVITGDCEVTSDDSSDGVPATYVPARNMIFLSVAVAWAESIKAGSVFIGANVRDYSGYPDCRQNFLRSFEKTADLGTRKKTKIKIKAPLLRMSKAAIVKKGRRLGVDFSATSSCYNPSVQGNACGVCESCIIRNRGMREAENE